MALEYGFYNAAVGSDGLPDRRYDATDLSKIFDGIILDGIYEQIGDRFMVRPIEGSLAVTVGSGRAWFNHTWTYLDGLLPITEVIDQTGTYISNKISRDVTRTTIYSVILEINTSEDVRANSIKLMRGTPSANPVPPVITNNENGPVWRYRIANINVAPGNDSTPISASDITYLVTTNPNPSKINGDATFVTGPLKSLPAGDFWAKWSTEFEEWMERNEQLFNEWYTTFTNESETDFISWYNRMKDQLSEDAAGNLQREIDSVNDDLNKDLNVKVDRFDQDTGILYLIPVERT